MAHLSFLIELATAIVSTWQVRRCAFSKARRWRMELFDAALREKGLKRGGSASIYYAWVFECSSSIKLQGSLLQGWVRRRGAQMF